MRGARVSILREIDLLPHREGTSRTGWQPTADALLTMERLTQPVAIHGKRIALILAVSGAAAFATACHWLRPLGSIKAPYFGSASDLGRVVIPCGAELV